MNRFCFVLIIFLSSGVCCSANEIFTDNFDAYTSGWTPSVGAGFWPCTKDIGGSCVQGGFSDYPLSSANPSTPESGGTRTYANSWNGWSKDGNAAISIVSSGGYGGTPCLKIGYTSPSGQPKTNLLKQLDSGYSELYVFYRIKFDDDSESWDWGGDYDSNTSVKLGRVFTNVDLTEVHANEYGSYSIHPSSYPTLIWNLGNPSSTDAITPGVSFYAEVCVILSSWTDEGGGIYSKALDTEPGYLLRDDILLTEGTHGSLNDDEWSYNSETVYVKFNPGSYTVKVYREISSGCNNTLCKTYSADGTPSTNPWKYFSPDSGESDQTRCMGHIILDGESGTDGTYQYTQTWHTFEYHIKLATTATSNDGYAEYWIDGNHAGLVEDVSESTNFAFNKDGGLINHIWLADNTVGTFDASGYISYYIDDVTISTTRVRASNSKKISIGTNKIIKLNSNTTLKIGG